MLQLLYITRQKILDNHNIHNILINNLCSAFKTKYIHYTNIFKHMESIYMEFNQRIKSISDKINKTKEMILTEEATKTSFIMPFIMALGYDVFNPSEVIPEYCADVGLKKGEKVDYAIKKDGKIVFLIEAKKASVSLDEEHSAQLYRYFSVTESRFAILTNGIEYYFYSDLEKSNQMDKNPFFVFNMLNPSAKSIKELTKFTNTEFSVDEILKNADRLKHMGLIQDFLENNFNNPDVSFVKFFLKRIYDGKLTQNVISKYTPIIKEAINLYITNEVNKKIQNALSEIKKEEQRQEEEQQSQEEQIEENKRELSDDEKKAVFLIRSVLTQIIDIERISFRKNKRYISLVIDNKIGNYFARIYLSTKNMYIGLFTLDCGKMIEERFKLDILHDIYELKPKIVDSCRIYLDS